MKFMYSEKDSLIFRWYKLDWIEQCFTSPPTQYKLYGRRFLQVKRPNQQYQSTEGSNSTQTDQTYNKQTWTQNTASPLVYNNMGWLGDSSYRGQGCQAWTAVGLPPRYALRWYKSWFARQLHLNGCNVHCASQKMHRWVNKIPGVSTDVPAYSVFTHDNHKMMAMITVDVYVYICHCEQLALTAVSRASEFIHKVNSRPHNWIENHTLEVWQQNWTRPQVQ